MRRQDIEKLIGGYGAGILTPEEEQTLFAAALEDQALFDALAGEQPLRDLLQDPAARASLLAALADRPLPWHRRMPGWLIRPGALAAVAAVLCLVVTATVWNALHRKAEPVLTAHVAPVAPVPVPEPQAVTEPAPPPPPRGKAAAKPKAEMLEMEAPLAKAPSSGLEPAQPGKAVAGAVGAVGGVPQTVGQLTPAPQRPQESDQIASAPPPPPAPKALAARAPEASPLEWSLLRRQPDGEFVHADAGSLQAGDAVKLRLESKEAGYAYVVEKQKVLASSQVEPGTPFDAALEPQGPGRRDLQLWFSPHPMAWAATGPARLEMSRMTAGNQVVSGVQAPRALKVPAANGPAAAGPVSIPITLNYQ